MGNKDFSTLYFGKLPDFSDFIRYNASGNDVLVFDQWLQQGLHSAKTQLNLEWNSAFENAPAYKFLFAPDSQPSLVGIWQPSRDSAGRKFPFVIAMRVDRQKFNERIDNLIPVIFDQFFNESRQLIQNAVNGLDLERITARTKSLSGPYMNDRRYKTYLSNTTVENFCTNLWGSFNNKKKYLLMTNLTEILLPLRKQDTSRFSLGLKFPLCTDHQLLGFNTSFWLEISMRLVGKSITTPFFFWTLPEAGESGNLFLFFRLPSAKNFVNLIQGDLENDNICELDQEGLENIDSVIKYLSNQYRSLIDTGNMTLDQFLQRL